MTASNELSFYPTDLTADELALQAQVRAFLERELPPGSFEPGLGMGAHGDKEFSLKLGANGYLGMAIPKRYGGGERKAVDRFVVVEELLRWGAPIGRTWVADRQTGPVLVKFGTEEQRERFLPGICRGEIAFSIGMSEPDSGSDLASVSTRATKTDGGWLLNGTKIWTTNAHINDWFIVLCRTDPDSKRHDGLSQLIVDLHQEGVEVKPIPYLDGTAEFNEVVMTDVFVPDELVLGQVGMGWAQNTSELAYERGGPDRWLSPFVLVQAFLREMPDLAATDAGQQLIGWATAKWFGLRRLSLSVARKIDAGGAPSAESSLVKEMGSRFEQDVIYQLGRLVDLEPSPESSSLFERLLVKATLTNGGFTIRGGTIEILRSVASKGLRS
ncbi:MAG: acyl-CoA dehydrogenase family protein [Acidimicrobiia bacterium]